MLRIKNLIDELRENLMDFSPAIDNNFILRLLTMWVLSVAFIVGMSIFLPFGIIIGRVDLAIIGILRITKKGIKEVLLNDLETLQKKCDSEGPLSFEGYTLPTTVPPISLNDFIVSCFFEINDRYWTVDWTEKVQCDPGRRRSLGDIYLICKTYYPECTVKQVLYHLVRALNNHCIHGCYCMTIRKFVFYTTTNNNAFDYYPEWSELKFQEIYNCVLKNEKDFN